MSQLVDWRGRPISSESERNEYRRGEQVAAFELPDGAIVSKGASMALHHKIRDDAQLRERLETAARMTGRRSLHLALCDRDNKHRTAAVEAAVEKNLEFGEAIQRERIKTDTTIPATKAGYDAISQN